ncbi:MAG: hypothetical protein APF76_11325 [Desulfitibacter sp. BRH_c19]|nr:MAG: hypothetical protein APF76_11325 [Desulfitibacter sp. BRH_c19]
MVQYKKDEIKQRIDTAALIVFAEKGYRGTKISDIGETAGVSVGNIYTYYKGKEEIFYSIMPEDLLDTFKSLLMDKISALKVKNNLHLDQFWLINNEVIEFMVGNRERILILLKKNQGTKYEHAKKDLIGFLLGFIKDNYTVAESNILSTSKSDLVIVIIYENLINTILNILELTKDLNEVREYLNIVNSYHLFGIMSLFRQKH